ncbi:unnamed protein product [Cunninghamella blakesleeana]
MEYYHKYSVTVEDYPEEEDSIMHSTEPGPVVPHTFDYNRLSGSHEENEPHQMMSWDQVNQMEELARKERLNDSTARKNAHKVAHLIQDDYLQQKNV